ncbi:hypothetical protein J5N97_007577 [Dioscorea zingiberensis]|uniref:Uncharacterized protein n=1 Tax=Dioscorea zingiberensis TaxID=325984 RepID=A0A9D5HUR3_9LILI|nr:hypothetical protein J5N97_007577 [Dioscorea zingiberensis]
MESASPHQRFFSSLDRVEKRMASEGATKTLIGANPIPISSPSDHQLSSPLYLLSSNPVPHSGTSSGPPLDFLSNMTPQEQRSPGDGDEDEIERLIELLGGEGSYLKYGKEDRRLDGWIEYYRRERKEPARLAHLLLAKAVSFSDNGGFAGMGFPSTVEEFLRHDPPAR